MQSVERDFGANGAGAVSGCGQRHGGATRATNDPFDDSPVSGDFAGGQKRLQRRLGCVPFEVRAFDAFLAGRPSAAGERTGGYPAPGYTPAQRPPLAVQRTRENGSA